MLIFLVVILCYYVLIIIVVLVWLLVSLLLLRNFTFGVINVVVVTWEPKRNGIMVYVVKC